MTTKASPILARTVEATKKHLVIETDQGRFQIPWQNCSPTLARADAIERSRFRVSPSGYGIHWPLLDEDLAIGPLVDAARPQVATSLDSATVSGS